MKFSWRIGNLKRKWTVNNTKHFSNLWKRDQRKTIIQILLIDTNIISKKRGCYERINWIQKSCQCPSSQFYHSEK